MNAERRKTLDALVKDADRLDNPQVLADAFNDAIADAWQTFEEGLDQLKGKANDLKEAIEAVKDEEQEAYDNMPEGLQSGDKGSMAEEAIGNLEEAINKLEELEGWSPSQPEISDVPDFDASEVVASLESAMG